MPNEGVGAAAAAVHATGPTGQPRRATCEPVAGVHVSYGGGAGGAPVEYRWNGTGLGAVPERARRTSTTAGQQVAPENVIIQFVDYAPTDVGDQFGVPIPEAQLVGEGEAWVLTGGGSVVEGTLDRSPTPRRRHHATPTPTASRSSSPPAAPGSRSRRRAAPRRL